MARNIKNEVYWELRTEQEDSFRWKDVETREKTLDLIYKRNTEAIEKELNDFLTKYAKDNQLTIGEASKNLTKDELKEGLAKLDDMLADYRNTKNPKMLARIKELQASKYKTRLELLKAQFQAQAMIMAGEFEGEIEDCLITMYKDTYLGMCGIYSEGLGIEDAFSTANLKYAEQAIKIPYSGMDFSSLVWDNTQTVSDAMFRAVALDMTRGVSIDKMAKNFKQYLNAKNTNSKGNPNYNIKRVLRTESKFVQEKAIEEANHEFGFEYYKVIVNEDEKMCSVCSKQIDVVYKEAERKYGYNSPPFHPHCRCRTVPVAKSNLKKRKETKMKFDGVYDEFEKFKKEFEVPDHITNRMITQLEESPKFIQDVWNKYADEIKFGTITYNGTSHFSPIKGVVNIDLPAKIKQGKDTGRDNDIFFHEIGHLFDTKAMKGLKGRIIGDERETFITSSVRNRAFTKTLKEEAWEYVEKAKKEHNANSSSNFTRSDFLKYLTKQFDENTQSDVSDMINGATDGAYQGYWGHSAEYWKRTQGNLPKEAFAEMFSATITSKNDSLKAIKTIFPKSYEIFKTICKEMVK